MPAPVQPAAHNSVVIDTNVVLDWLVFSNPAGLQLGLAVSQGSLQWLGTEATMQELAQVLARDALQRWQPQLAGAWATANRLCLRVDGPAAAARPPPGMVCTDSDDQKFIDLALARQARWLVSRDKAVLRLARRARALGLQALTPEAWVAGCPWT